MLPALHNAPESWKRWLLTNKPRRRRLGVSLERRLSLSSFLPVDYIVFIPCILHNNRVSQIIDSMAKGVIRLFAYCHGEDINRMLDSVRKDQLVSVQPVDLVYGYGFWWSCILLLIHLAHWQLLHGVSYSNRLLVGEVIEWSVTHVWQIWDWMPFIRSPTSTNFQNLSSIYACLPTSSRCSDSTRVSTVASNPGSVTGLPRIASWVSVSQSFLYEVD